MGSTVGRRVTRTARGGTGYGAAMAEPITVAQDASADAPPTLRASATFVGSAIWFERRAFEVVGGLVATTAEPGVRSVLSAVSHHHAWRADQLVTVLAQTHDLRPEDVVEAGDGFGDAALAALVVEADAGAARAARVVALLDRWIEHLSAHRSRLVPVADAPLIRVLDLVVDDLGRDRAALAACCGPAS